MNIKAAGIILGVGLFALAPVAEAQRGSCNASVTKRTITRNREREKTWDIIFDVAAPACDASAGKFSFEIVTSGEKRTERVRETSEFTTENGQRGAFIYSYHAKPGFDVVDVTGVIVTQCSCRPNN